MTLSRPTAPHRTYLREALALAREAQAAGSSPACAVLVNADGEIVGRGRNRLGEARPPEHVGAAGVAHAGMDLVFAAGKLRDAETLTLYISLEPCLMCDGASAWLGRERYPTGTAGVQ